MLLVGSDTTTLPPQKKDMDNNTLLCFLVGFIHLITAGGSTDKQCKFYPFLLRHWTQGRLSPPLMNQIELYGLSPCFRPIPGFLEKQMRPSGMKSGGVEESGPPFRVFLWSISIGL